MPEIARALEANFVMVKLNVDEVAGDRAIVWRFVACRPT